MHFEDTARDEVTPPVLRSSLAFRALSGAVLGTLVLIVLFERVSPKLVVGELSSANGPRLFLAATFVALSYVCRAALWQRLLSRSHDYSYGALFRSTMIGYLANNILPARAGDVVRGLWLWRLCGGAKAAILGSLALERILDVATIVGILAVSSMLLRLHERWLATSAGTLAAMVLLFFVAAAGMRLATTDAAVAWVLGLTRGTPLLARLRGVGGAIRGVGSVIDVANARRGLLMLALTWFVTFWGLYFTLDSLGLSQQLGVPGVALVLSISGVGLAIPSLPASLGTHQAAFVFAAALVGLPEAAGLSASFLYQALWVAITSVLGLLSLTWDSVIPGRKRDWPHSRPNSPFRPGP